jgi:hypothetical protein
MPYIIFTIWRFLKDTFNYDKFFSMKSLIFNKKQLNVYVWHYYAILYSLASLININILRTVLGRGGLSTFTLHQSDQKSVHLYSITITYSMLKH